MEKKRSGLSQHGKLVSVRAEDIFNKPLSKRQQADLTRLKKLPDEEIDYSDLPELSDAQLSKAFRPKRQLVAVRLEEDILGWLRGFGPGYSTRINNILRVVMENAVSKSGRRGGTGTRRSPR